MKFSAEKPRLRKAAKRWRSFAIKIQLTILILTLTTSTTVGQNRELTTDSDTVFWAKYYKTVFE
jgi:hypothetical protein